MFILKARFHQHFMEHLTSCGARGLLDKKAFAEMLFAIAQGKDSSVHRIFQAFDPKLH